MRPWDKTPGLKGPLLCHSRLKKGGRGCPERMYIWGGRATISLLVCACMPKLELSTAINNYISRVEQLQHSSSSAVDIVRVKGEINKSAKAQSAKAKMAQ